MCHKRAATSSTVAPVVSMFAPTKSRNILTVMRLPLYRYTLFDPPGSYAIALPIESYRPLFLSILSCDCLGAFFMHNGACSLRSISAGQPIRAWRSEERRVGKEGRFGWLLDV